MHTCCMAEVLAGWTVADWHSGPSASRVLPFWTFPLTWLCWPPHPLCPLPGWPGSWGCSWGQCGLSADVRTSSGAFLPGVMLMSWLSPTHSCAVSPVLPVPLVTPGMSPGPQTHQQGMAGAEAASGCEGHGGAKGSAGAAPQHGALWGWEQRAEREGGLTSASSGHTGCCWQVHLGVQA